MKRAIIYLDIGAYCILASTGSQNIRKDRSPCPIIILSPVLVHRGNSPLSPNLPLCPPFSFLHTFHLCISPFLCSASSFFFFFFSFFFFFFLHLSFLLAPRSFISRDLFAFSLSFSPPHAHTYCRPPASIMHLKRRRLKDRRLGLPSLEFFNIN